MPEHVFHRLKEQVSIVASNFREKLNRIATPPREQTPNVKAEIFSIGVGLLLQEKRCAHAY